MTKSTGRAALTQAKADLHEVADLVERRGILSVGAKAGVLVKSVALAFDVLIDLSRRVEALEKRDGE